MTTIDSSAKKKEPKLIRTKDLFGNDSMVLIEHEGTVYRLLITRQGKLVLNK